jgi:hypothetical protein
VVAAVAVLAMTQIWFLITSCYMIDSLILVRSSMLPGPFSKSVNLST